MADLLNYLTRSKFLNWTFVYHVLSTWEDILMKMLYHLLKVYMKLTTVLQVHILINATSLVLNQISNLLFVVKESKRSLEIFNVFH